MEIAKVLNKVLYVYDVQRDIWFWYKPDQDLFYACDQMSEEQYALPTLMSTTAIIGTRNLEDYPEVVAELQELFKRSLHIPHTECVEMNKLCSALSLLSIS